MKQIRVALLAGVLAAPAAAQPILFSAIVKEEVGYSTNPFLRATDSRGAASSTTSVAPKLDYETALSDTQLVTSYTRDEYFSGFGYTDSLNVGLHRTDKLSQHLSSSLSGDYRTSNRAVVFDDATQTVTDPLDIGRRTRRYQIDGQIQWQISEFDQLSYGSSVSHTGYGKSKSDVTAITRDYTSYALNASYNHVLDARTSVGLQGSLSTVHSQAYPQSRAIQPSVTAKRQLNAIWTVDGHLGLVLQHIDGPLPRSTTSLGYGLNLCGVYPRTRICLSAERASTPSGAGGLRQNDSGHLSVTRDLTEHSRVSLGASYSRSNASAGSSIIVGEIRRSSSVGADADYDRDVSQRISVGFGGRYQSRELSHTGNTRSVTGTVHISAKLGRL